MESWERKFIVDPQGNAEEVELSEEEKKKRFEEMHPKKKKIVIKINGQEVKPNVEPPLKIKVNGKPWKNPNEKK